MPRRRRTLTDDIFDILEKVSIVYVLILALFGFTNKVLFWKMLLWGLVFLGVLIIIALFIKKSKIHKQSQWRTDRELLGWLRELKPWDFESYIAELFTKLGYKTTVTGGGYDRGVDIVAEKDGLKHYIQCKKYITSSSRS